MPRKSARVNDAAVGFMLALLACALTFHAPSRCTLAIAPRRSTTMKMSSNRTFAWGGADDDDALRLPTGVRAAERLARSDRIDPRDAQLRGGHKAGAGIEK